MYKKNPYIVPANTTPSIYQENPKITSTIKENPDKHTVEIEKNEVVVSPDLSGVYKASGEKHYNGGIKTYLPEGSFVFSDDKSLALDEGDHKLFELKEGGNFNKRNNTPAKVLQRSFKPEEYNSMVDKITDKNTDDITKRSAGLMLNKYEDTLGKIAFIQEGKKDYPSSYKYYNKGDMVDLSLSEIQNLTNKGYKIKILD